MQTMHNKCSRRTNKNKSVPVHGFYCGSEVTVLTFKCLYHLFVVDPVEVADWWPSPDSVMGGAAVLRGWSALCVSESVDLRPHTSLCRLTRG